MERLLFACIIATITLSTEAQSYEIQTKPLDLSCKVNSDIKPFFIIRSNLELKESGCRFISYPFNRKSIIGISGSTGGCFSPEVYLQLFKNDKEKKYQIIAKVVQYGVCRRHNNYFIILECDKLDPLYEIETKIIKENH